LKPGDVVFFKDSTGKINHSAIYGGNDQIIHPLESKGVSVTGLKSSSYWYPRYEGAKRITSEPPIDTSNPIVAEALKYEGAPYLSGGDNPAEGFNSSGFVQYVFLKGANIRLPRTAKEQYLLGTSIGIESLKPGDVVFFKDSTGKINHSAIYVGNDRIIHPLESKGVAITGLKSSSYWYPRYEGAKRITSEPPIDTLNSIVAEALKYEGAPYLLGGMDPNTGIDCSAFTQLVFKEAKNINLPRSTEEQWELGKSVSKSELESGDLIFFSNTYREGISHVAIYIGGNRMIHATNTYGVTITYLTDVYYAQKYTGAKRL